MAETTITIEDPDIHKEVQVNSNGSIFIGKDYIGRNATVTLVFEDE